MSDQLALTIVPLQGVMPPAVDIRLADLESYVHSIAKE